MPVELYLNEVPFTLLSKPCDTVIRLPLMKLPMVSVYPDPSAGSVLILTGSSFTKYSVSANFLSITKSSIVIMN